MILSDRDIRKAIREGRLVFQPRLKPVQIGPASIDLRLGPIFKTFHVTKLSLVDPKQGLPEDYMDTYRLKPSQPFVLHPNHFILASTLEYLKVANDIAVRAEGKSTLARMGILVHTAGFVDPGFEGVLTLEISNQSNVAVALYPRMYICQIAVEFLSSPAEVPYNKRQRSLYRKQRAPAIANPKNLFER